MEPLYGKIIGCEPTRILMRSGRVLACPTDKAFHIGESVLVLYNFEAQTVVDVWKTIPDEPPPQGNAEDENDYDDNEI